MEQLIPNYWMHETSGVLRAVVEKYLAAGELDEGELALMRAYLRQWLASPLWNAGTTELRVRVDDIRATRDLRDWLDDALNAGIDPL
jgi:hypothetical protein